MEAVTFSGIESESLEIGRALDLSWIEDSEFHKGVYSAIVVKDSRASISAIVHKDALPLDRAMRLKELGLSVEIRADDYYFIKGSILLTEVDKIEEARKLLLLR